MNFTFLVLLYDCFLYDAVRVFKMRMFVGIYIELKGHDTKVTDFIKTIQNI